MSVQCSDGQGSINGDRAQRGVGGIAVTAGIITKVSGPVCIGGGCEGSATDLG